MNNIKKYSALQVLTQGKVILLSIILGIIFLISQKALALSKQECAEKYQIFQSQCLYEIILTPVTNLKNQKSQPYCDSLGYTLGVECGMSGSGNYGEGSGYEPP